MIVTDKRKKCAWHAARLYLVAALGLSLTGIFPSQAQASTNPVDLVLDDDVAMPLIVDNIEPGDSGAKTVALTNIGSRDGFVTIWIHDVVNLEGMNPESETGDMAEPGELGEHLLLGVSGEKVKTSLSLPATIENFPQRATAPDFIEITLLQAGDTVSLQWQWQIPAKTDNDVQGDSISLTINYLLQEIPSTDVSDVVTEEGEFTEEVTVKTEVDNSTLAIPRGTTSQTVEGEPLTKIWIIKIDKEKESISEDAATVSDHFEAGPEGLTFDQPVTITLSYDYVPPRVSPSSLYIAVWDEDAYQWVKLESTVDLQTGTVSAQVYHFSRYVVAAPIPPKPEPGAGNAGDGVSPPPSTTGPEKEEVEEITLKVGMLGDESTVVIKPDGTTGEALKITDRDGNFSIFLNSGSRVFGSNGMLLSRIELTIADQSITVPDDIVLLSPLYRVTGYVNDFETYRTNFDPPARLSIRYDPRYLPDNTLVPFIAYYDIKEGLVPVGPPPGAMVEIGMAEALISHASLFIAAARQVPSPPPLPPMFEAGNLIINPRQNKIGEPVVISLEIANTSDVTGAYGLQLKVDGIIRMMKEVTVAARSRETVSFNINNLSVGKHQVQVAGLNGEFRTISAAVLPGISSIDWRLLDLGIGSVVLVGLLTLYWLRRRLS